MKISRHARNNMRLYGINARELEEAIQSPDFSEKKGDRIFVYKLFPDRFSGFPLKVVFESSRKKLKLLS